LKRILVVDDDRQIRLILRTSLQSSGYIVETADDGFQALQKFEASRPDLLITDLSRPELNGIELTQAVRRVSTTPIIVLSVRDSDNMKVTALDEGADDYLTKPFSMKELLARVRAQLRRSHSDPEKPEDLRDGDFQVDLAAHRATLAGTELRLTPKEFDLLVFLLRNAGRVLTHKVLLREIWGPSAESQPEYIRVLIGQLRKKLDVGNGKRYVISEPWIGYRIAPDGTAEEPAPSSRSL